MVVAATSGRLVSSSHHMNNSHGRVGLCYTPFSPLVAGVVAAVMVVACKRRVIRAFFLNLIRQTLLHTRYDTRAEDFYENVKAHRFVPKQRRRFLLPGGDGGGSECAWAEIRRVVCCVVVKKCITADTS